MLSPDGRHAQMLAVAAHLLMREEEEYDSRKVCGSGAGDGPACLPKRVRPQRIDLRNIYNRVRRAGRIWQPF